MALLRENGGEHNEFRMIRVWVSFAQISTRTPQNISTISIKLRTIEANQTQSTEVMFDRVPTKVIRVQLFGKCPIPNHTGVFGTAAIPYQTLRQGSVRTQYRYTLDRKTGGSGICSVRPQYLTKHFDRVWYEFNTVYPTLRQVWYDLNNGTHYLVR